MKYKAEADSFLIKLLKNYQLRLYIAEADTYDISVGDLKPKLISKLSASVLYNRAWNLFSLTFSFGHLKPTLSIDAKIHIFTSDYKIELLDSSKVKPSSSRVLTELFMSSLTRLHL